MRAGSLFSLSYKEREGGRVGGKASVLGGEMMREEYF